MGFELKKVFDCQKMPEDVRKAFFSDYQDLNDWLVEVFLDDCTDMQLVTSWLLANGAVMEDESVIVKHWW